jgi:ribonucleotide reductase beta subunit family protein with ferritin-like domain
MEISDDMFKQYVCWLADKDITYIKGELKYKEYLMEFLQEMREQKLNEILK